MQLFHANAFAFGLSLSISFLAYCIPPRNCILCFVSASASVSAMMMYCPGFVCICDIVV